jgi:hypothetical protein
MLIPKESEIAIDYLASSLVLLTLEGHCYTEVYLTIHVVDRDKFL